MRPAITRLRPQIVSSSVVFPEPVLPINTTHCPAGTSNEMSLSWKPPARTVSFSRAIISTHVFEARIKPKRADQQQNEYGRDNHDQRNGHRAFQIARAQFQEHAGWEHLGSHPGGPREHQHRAKFTER